MSAFAHECIRVLKGLWRLVLFSFSERTIRLLRQSYSIAPSPPTVATLGWLLCIA
jgi:hypothetical protein